MGDRRYGEAGVVREPGEINYGTGRDVAEESIADAKVPLQIAWSTDSYIDVPSRE